MPGNIFYFEWELTLIKAIQAHFGSFGVLISQFLSLLGQEYPLVAIVVILYFSSNKDAGKKICFNLMSALVWVPMLKNIAFRIRPYFAHEDVKILLAPYPSEDTWDMLAQGYSFPSAHSACAVAAYPMLGKILGKTWTKVLGIIIPIAIGVSRFCVGAHYPTDVLAGWAVGLIVLIVMPILYEKIKNEDLARFIILATGIPGFFYCQSEDFFTGYGLMLGACFGFLVERKYVNFKPTKKVLRVIVRSVIGLGIFLAFAQGIKFILGEGNIVRVFRYAVGAFITLGIYPMLFKKFEKEN